MFSTPSVAKFKTEIHKHKKTKISLTTESNHFVIKHFNSFCCTLKSKYRIKQNCVPALSSTIFGNLIALVLNPQFPERTVLTFQCYHAFEQSFYLSQCKSIRVEAFFQGRRGERHPVFTCKFVHHEENEAGIMQNLLGMLWITIQGGKTPP